MYRVSLYPCSAWQERHVFVNASGPLYQSLTHLWQAMIVLQHFDKIAEGLIGMQERSCTEVSQMSCWILIGNLEFSLRCTISIVYAFLHVIKLVLKLTSEGILNTSLILHPHDQNQALPLHVHVSYHVLQLWGHTWKLPLKGITRIQALK